MFKEILDKQKVYFNNGETLSVSKRYEYLKRLKNEIVSRDSEILEALYKDFKKPEFEAVLTETQVVVSDINDTLKHLKKWTKPKRVASSLLNFPSSNKIYSEPYGNTLIISPWNYPFQLAFSPLIAAIAAGNTVILKPSELTPNTANVVASIISKIFPKEYVSVIQGNADVSQKLLQLRWDYIFFTGSVAVGKTVAKAAAKYLTPITLELGGKNPCIIDASSPIQLTAKRIVWGKFLNAGQTCIAPDYILVEKSVKQNLIDALIVEIELAYSKNNEDSKDYSRIINTKHYERLKNYLEDQNIIYGGQTNSESNYIAPTLIDSPKINTPVMSGEIFGPILPIIGYKTYETISKYINTYEKPLALYVFSTNKTFVKKILSNFSFGGGCINDTLIHFANPKLPFGGVGHSGIGSYHGKYGFDTFSHKKSIVKKGNWLDLPFRYAPYNGKTKLIKTLFKWLA